MSPQNMFNAILGHMSGLSTANRSVITASQERPCAEGHGHGMSSAVSSGSCKGIVPEWLAEVSN